MSDMRAKYFLLGISVVAIAGMLGTMYVVPSVTATTSTASLQYMMGHFTVEVADSDGNIIQYMQTDNVVTTQGVDCALTNLFGATAGAGACASGSAVTFNFIQLASSATLGNVLNTTAQQTATEVAREAAGSAPDAGTIPTMTASNTLALSETFTVIAAVGGANNALETDETVGATGLFDSVGPGGGNMLASADLPGMISGLNMGDTVAISWTVSGTGE